MEILINHKTELAFLLVRLILGILFLTQGYDKLFVIGLRATEKGMDRAMMNTHLSNRLINVVTTISSVIEFICGLFLVAGFLTVPALLFLAANLVMVALGMSLREPLWDMRHYWPRLVMVITLLLLPAGHDIFSLDHFLHLCEQTVVNG